jgi:hypothetical protein
LAFSLQTDITTEFEDEMATSTLRPVGNNSFFAEVESKKGCFSGVGLVSSLEPATKKLKLEVDTAGEGELPKLPEFSAFALAADNRSQLKRQFQQNLHQWEELHHRYLGNLEFQLTNPREEMLIRQAKTLLTNLEGTESLSTIRENHYQLASEINNLMEHRQSTLGALLEASILVSSWYFRISCGNLTNAVLPLHRNQRTQLQLL